MNRKVGDNRPQKIKRAKQEPKDFDLNGEGTSFVNRRSKDFQKQPNGLNKHQSNPINGCNYPKKSQKCAARQNPSILNDTMGSKATKGSLTKKDFHYMRPNWGFGGDSSGIGNQSKHQHERKHQKQTQSFEKISRKVTNSRRKSHEARSCQSTPDKKARKRNQESGSKASALRGQSRFRVETPNERKLLRMFNQRHLDYALSLGIPLDIERVEASFQLYMRSLREVQNSILFIKDRISLISMKKASVDSSMLQKRKNPIEDLSQIRRKGNRLRTGACPPSPVERQLNYLQKQRENAELEKMRKTIVQDIDSQKWKNKDLVWELPGRNGLDNENIYDINRISLEHHSMDPFSIFKSKPMTSSEIKNLEDLDGNVLAMSLNFTKKRLFLVDPKQWVFSVENAKQVIKMQTDSNQSNELVASGAEPLHSVLIKLWWEEYIPFDLFNHLSHREKYAASNQRVFLQTIIRQKFSTQQKLLEWE